MGGGALPLLPLPGYALALSRPPFAPQQLEARLRQATPPVIARVEQDAVLLDLRTIPPAEVKDLLAALQGVMDRLEQD